MLVVCDRWDSREAAKPRSGNQTRCMFIRRAADGSPRVPRLAVCPARSRECGRQHGRDLLRCERGRFIGMVLQVADLLCLSWFAFGRARLLPSRGRGLRRSEMFAAGCVGDLSVRSQGRIIPGSFLGGRGSPSRRFFRNTSDDSSEPRVSGSSEWCRCN